LGEAVMFRCDGLGFGTEKSAEISAFTSWSPQTTDEVVATAVRSELGVLKWSGVWDRWSSKFFRLV